MSVPSRSPDGQEGRGGWFSHIMPRVHSGTTSVKLSAWEAMDKLEIAVLTRARNVFHLGCGSKLGGLNLY